MKGLGAASTEPKHSDSGEDECPRHPRRCTQIPAVRKVGTVFANPLGHHHPWPVEGPANAHDTMRTSRISSRTIQIAATMDQQNKHEVARRGAWGGQTSDGISPSELAWGGGLPWTPSCYTSPSSASIYSRGPLRVETRGVGHSPSSSGGPMFWLTLGSVWVVLASSSGGRLAGFCILRSEGVSIGRISLKSTDPQ